MEPLDDVRTAKLKKLFDTVLQGKQALGPKNANLFIEAVCAQPDPVTCISKIVESTAGLSSIQSVMRFDLSLSFFNGHAGNLISYIQAPDLKTIGGGNFLNDVILKIVDPPIFWTPFRKAFQAGSLEENGQKAFAWLLLQLITFPGTLENSYIDLAKDTTITDRIVASSNLDARTIGQKIKHILETQSSGISTDSEHSPGGRHDNDFVDFRQISILPTADEIISSEPAFYRPSAWLEDSKTAGTRLGDYIDNQFRLLREDMLYEMREELQIALKKKKGHHRGFVVEGLKLLDVHCGTDSKRSKWGITLECEHDLWQLKKLSGKKRQAHLKDNHNIVKHQSLVCLLVDDEIVAFMTVNRDEELLARKPPVFILQLEREASTVGVLLKLKMANRIKLIQVDTAIFSFEPVLKALQGIKEMPLSPELLFWTKESVMEIPTSLPTAIIHALRANPLQNLQSLIGTPKSIHLDNSQAESLLSGLAQRVSLIQGPPGTGKSFIGALLAKVLHDTTQHIILVVCYTNHALDQFLEDLLDIGIPQTSLVRLGGKSTQRTEPFSIRNQRSNFKLGRSDWKVIDELRAECDTLRDGLQRAFQSYKQSNIGYREILMHLEFEDELGDYFDAFRVPSSVDGMTRVTKKGRAVGPHYLINQWSNGWDAGMFKQHASIIKASVVWSMAPAARRAQITKWKLNIQKEEVATLQRIARDYNDRVTRLDRKFDENISHILRSKRIIGCTTTAAAKYCEDIQAASPGILLVEEAGEILESHILTALGSNTKQLILIGDHQQLRPKVNNYKLTVEKGEGFDLNRSLFERLVLKGYPHTSLTEQHRMRPEIAALVRHLTYPNLVDAEKTKGRPDLRGVRNNIVFINHDSPEDDDSRLADRRDESAKSSKQNRHETQMILKIVRYLAQQGYGTDKVVILTPYLGQLQQLRTALSDDSDPVLSDLDSFDLVRAGLMTATAANVNKKKIRLATIDNFQGEESPIVIVSMTRSNPDHDIGFMQSPERLNVLLSRARDALIMIGNIETFLHARRGSELWSRLFEVLKVGGNIYDGFPVKCERHPDRTALLRLPDEFDEMCPDGGCKEPCGSRLNCGVHDCPSKCHQLYDHSKMPCEYIVYSKCSKGHDQSRKCHETPAPTCAKCDREAKLALEKQQKAFELQQRRDAEQLAHDKKMADIEEQMTSHNQALRDTQLAEDRKIAIRQKLKDLEMTASLASHTTSNPTTIDNSLPVTSSASTSSAAPPPEPESASRNEKLPTPASQPKPSQTKIPAQVSMNDPLQSSPSEAEWKRQKAMEGARNDHIDMIMDMIGLEAVKWQVLEIKAKIEVSKRQNTSVKDERFNIVFLGNPGTGKTTVARLYAKFLTSVDVLPGNAFIETTGSRLANDGVAGVKKHIEEVINAGGGAIFVDEAYQLTSQHNFQGRQVLDFLLAEMENSIGKIVFMLAGYTKEMEKFFEHNSGLKSRVPYDLKFADYEDRELLAMFEKLIDKEVQRENEGRGRGTDGFGNARALHNMFTKVAARQALRLASARRQGLTPDDLLFVKEDLIGPDPSEARNENKSWELLQSLTGLAAVKTSISNLFDQIEVNYKRELMEKDPIQVSLNRVFLGSPGTGKTSVAKLYGQILADIGLLSNGEVVTKNPADFVGSHLGESEEKTKAILANTVGKAYMLYQGGQGTGNQSDPYKTAVIDTIVAEVQSVPGEDRCVLLLGYKSQMEEMFQNVNPGLARRFDIENAFHFEDFTNTELLEILNFKLKKKNLEATDAAKAVAIDVLARARNRPNFGNGGEVENIIGHAQSRFQTRQKALPPHHRSYDVVFEPQDFDPEFDRDANASTNLAKLFEDVVGCEDIVCKLGEYQNMARRMKIRNKNQPDLIPTSFVFKGPPGTGKTTTARKFGQVYYDMGFLSSTEVIECSASDLVGEYVGQTGPKTKKLFEKALGRVLFIDEAYRLGEGHFAKEAIDELVGIMTQDAFKSKLVVILAGYDQEMNSLMAVNTGLSSRFPQEIIFRNMTPQHCLNVLNKALKKNEVCLAELEMPSSPEYKVMVSLIDELSGLSSWGNARDMQTLSQEMIRVAFKSLTDDDEPGGNVVLDAQSAISSIESMLSARRERSQNIPVKTFPSSSNELRQQKISDQSRPPALSTQSAKAAAPQVRQDATDLPPSDGLLDDERDDGVTDHVWQQLQLDKAAEENAMKAAGEAERALQQEVQAAIEHEKKAQQVLAQKMAKAARAKDAAERDERKRKLEKARLLECAARAERARAAAALEAKRHEEEERRKQEAVAQRKLQQLGVCVAGFRWIKQASGYRCAGGSHFVGNEALGL
ncbi:P-loop containing nucleoside triphosphate hydrolase protein [Rickenella mellea]|uniref:P-loop containing nucleoside triphosphate hydrolase protein n=1 Tax=Rickenella mellea TaxID=50990 RepID=A0A4R5XID4_9AGAM|nr:P-loop containing nucleoside triphosphate hydrolase protein [Rickenella mellea]